ncbi:MAG TPA: hypothetical protein VG943_11675 [Caulobacterales bacterium]|nr:hypothetical protein [Caulobacterales bacterium]
MRTGFRPLRRIGAALALAGALALLPACQPQQPSGSGDEASSTAPTDEEREAQMAAQQLAALGGPANAETQALYQGDFQASGSLDANGEGAWELRLLNDYAQLSRPGLGEDGGVPGPRDFHEKGMRVVAGPLTITIQAQTCPISNGQNFDYTAHVLFEGVDYEGCARRGVSEGDSSTWASVLPDLIPAIDACLARASAKPARVTIASALDEGQVSVRLREADGDRRECIVTADGATVSAYESLSDVDRRNGESDPEFQRGGSAPAARHCQAVTEAKSASGASLGWLISRSC